jgi:hypothetical protein
MGPDFEEECNLSQTFLSHQQRKILLVAVWIIGVDSANGGWFENRVISYLNESFNALDLT